MSSDKTRKTALNDARRIQLRKAVVDWLWSRRRRPDGLALDMGMFHKSDKIDVGAVWLGNGVFKVSGCAFICCPERRDCWPSCSVSENILNEVVSLKKLRNEMELSIREKEPELRETDMLFEELAQWNYAQSSNEKYHELCQRIESLENMLYKGTTLQHISEHPLCSRMYVVVPEGLLSCEELCDDWGLLWLKEDGSISEVRPSKRHKLQEEDSYLFLRRIMNCNTMARKAFLDFKNKNLSKKG